MEEEITLIFTFLQGGCRVLKVYESDFITDPRTGIRSFITGRFVSERQAQGSAAANRERAAAIKGIVSEFKQRKPVKDVLWSSYIARRAEEIGLPLIAPKSLGIEFDDLGLWERI